jgi:hypothetical protein
MVRNRAETRASDQYLVSLSLTDHPIVKVSEQYFSAPAGQHCVELPTPKTDPMPDPQSSFSG